ncbi:cytochrome p450 [Naegleria gruberi]|uniref:Cytochrome p450 n=1 Tax=Naegleria gruberi TaxID=5762 RepID=D2VNQ7_NAEGR|nr:cytochrome p450 [Naegleria gruberi]EFC41452.1 cytochrome p450 [Naegleria gruberi]|eukprot:XP_002674196.1 cytochrome p450 [Naegleria gruberi strain NEG-M]
MSTQNNEAQCPFASADSRRNSKGSNGSNQPCKEEPIPQPEPHFLVGNIFTVDKKNPFPSFIELAKKFDGIFKMNILGKQLVVVYSQELVNELCDESRFEKALPPGLKHVKEFGGDGLFTAENNEPNWAIAHRILMPAFGPKSIQDMYPQMYDIAEQLCTKWERLGEHSVIDIVDNMTRLTLDTIALCAFNYRFNSFYHNEMHPFVQSMFEALQEASSRTKRPSILNNVLVKTKKKHQRNIEYMHAVADEIVKDRKKNPSDVNDLLNRMLLGKDPVTNQGLSDENIRYQMVTFLIAGHETTSGLLSFTLYELLKHPEVLKKAQKEVDTVIGNENIQIKHIPQLVYLDQILKETLRLWPTAPGFGLGCKTDQVIGGKYRIHPSDFIIVSNSNLHRDKKVWGEDCEQFNPDRMSPENFSSLPSNSWKPFGNGSRGCIGRPFAWQEAILVLAMVLQRFELIENDPNYHLSITQALTIKPNGLFLKVKPRSNWKGSQLVRTNASNTSSENSHTDDQNSTSTESKGPLLVLYGSNSGTCESFASMLHQDAKSKGFDCKVGRLNTFTGNIPLDTPILIVTASYEGQPTEDAKQFVGWLEHVPENTLKGLKYAVFGCGHSDWVDTYQRIPTFIDNKLSEAGGERIAQRGIGNAAKDLFCEFDQWRKTLWSSFDPHTSHELPPVETTIIKGHRETILHFQSLEPGKVIENYDLVPEDYCDDHGTCRSKRHIEIQLPAGAHYESGDYLSVLPVNSMKVVNKALSHFKLTHDDQIVLKRSETISSSSYPVNEPISAVNLFMNYFELSQPATKRQLEILLEHTKEASDKQVLQQLIEKDSNIPPILDIVHDLKSCTIPLGNFLDISIPMRTRQYSISSSPLWNKDKCTITVGVLRAPATHGKGFHEGVASNFLASCLPDMQVSVQIRNSSFKLPNDPSVPIIMIGAGTGIAPFRGFVQERACLIKEGKTLGKALLFQGCRNPEQDYLYKKELEEWSQLGAVELRPVFSRMGSNVKYVQDKIMECKEEVAKLLLEEAQIYICGEGNHMAPAVKKVLMEIYQQVTNCTKEEAEKRMSSMDKRFAVDVFA